MSFRCSAALRSKTCRQPVSPIRCSPVLDLTIFSLTVQQVDTRLSQALSWPSQYSLIRQTLNASAAAAPDVSSLSLGRAHYIQLVYSCALAVRMIDETFFRFYNNMWLIANDIIVGSAFTSFVCENSEYFGQMLGRIIQVS